MGNTPLSSCFPSSSGDVPPLFGGFTQQQQQQQQQAQHHDSHRAPEYQQPQHPQQHHATADEWADFDADNSDDEPPSVALPSVASAAPSLAADMPPGRSALQLGRPHPTGAATGARPSGPAAVPEPALAPAPDFFADMLVSYRPPPKADKSERGADRASAPSSSSRLALTSDDVAIEVGDDGAWGDSGAAFSDDDNNASLEQRPATKAGNERVRHPKEKRLAASKLAHASFDDV